MTSGFPGALRLCLIIFGAIAAVWFSGPGGTVPSENRWQIWGTPAASIFAGVVLGDEINFGRLIAPIKLLGDASYVPLASIRGHNHPVALGALESPPFVVRTSAPRRRFDRLIDRDILVF
jgi:hypothetical protein